MEKKYELTNETTVVDGHVLHRIKALRDFGCVEKGDLGGWIEKEKNLSHEGDCWVYNNAKVYQDAQITENALIYQNACVYGDASVYGNARITDDARIFGAACIGFSVRVNGHCSVSNTKDLVVIGPIGSRNDYTTFSRSKNGINVSCGCFSGTIEAFENQVKFVHKGTEYEKEYLDAIEFAKKRLLKNGETKESNIQRKYELTADTVNMYGYELYRIQALKTFGDVHKGDLGGWIESEENLSQEGLCWVYDTAKVFEHAVVMGDAKIRDRARIYGKAWVFGEARVFGDAVVCDNAKVFGNVRVHAHAKVQLNAKVNSNSVIEKSEDVLVLGPMGPNDEYATFSKAENSINVVYEYFSGNLDAFEEMVKTRYAGTSYERDHLDAIDFAKKKLQKA